MSSIDLVRNEIRELEREIEELEELEDLNASDEEVIEIDDDDNNDDKENVESIENEDDKTVFSNIGQMDQLLYDILNENTPDDGESDIKDGKRIIKSKELQKFYGSQIPKIQVENVYRFNGITVFPLSNDPSGEFIGIRFDVFNTYSRKFTTCHYIILKQFEIENDEKQSISLNGDSEWRWEVFQTTVPKYIPVEDLANSYLNLLHVREQTTENSVPGFNRINKLAMRIYEHLVLLEERKSIVLQLKETYSNTDKVHIKSDLAVSKIEVVVSHSVIVADTATHVIVEKHGRGDAITLPDLAAVFAALKTKIEILLR